MLKYIGIALAILLNNYFLYSVDQTNYVYQLAVAAIFQNEAPYLKEWLEFHKLVGVEHFYLYNNNSTDNYLEVLQPYINNGEVELINWPYTWSQGEHRAWIAIQCNAYKNALKKATTEQQKTHWLALLDIDEFLFPLQENTIPAVLKNYEDCAGVCVNWQLFGTSYVSKMPANKLLIETFTLKAAVNHSRNYYVKSIIKPECVQDMHDAHVVDYKFPYFQVNTAKERFQGARSPTVCTNTLVINHYWTRDEHSFQYKLRLRQKKGQSIHAWRREALQYNYIADTAILRFAPALRKQMGLIL